MARTRATDAEGDVLQDGLDAVGFVNVVRGKHNKPVEVGATRRGLAWYRTGMGGSPLRVIKTKTEGKPRLLW